MNEDFDLSIVISSYNREDKVVKTVKSIFESDLSSFRHIDLMIVDDGSPRPVEPVLQNIGATPSNITLRVMRQTNAGIGATRNRGFREALAGQIIFLDDDIILEKKNLREMVEGQKEISGSIIFGTYPFITYSSPSLEKFANHFFGYDQVTREKNFEKTEAITSGLLFVNKTKLNGFHEFYKDDLSIPAAEEHEIMFRFFRSGIPVFNARHIAAIHNHHLELSWLAQQQYKYGLATAEAFVKYPGILEMKKFREWKKSFTTEGKSLFRKILKRSFDSSIGRKTWLVLARFMEKMAPRKDHDFIFGMLVSVYFRAGYRVGLNRFSK